MVLRGASVAPSRVPIGGAVEIAFEVASTARRTQRVLVDLQVAYAGARAGADRVKVFKLVAGELAPGAAIATGKRLSLRQMSTRTHHPGLHRVAALVNGTLHPVGTFELLPAEDG